MRVVKELQLPGLRKDRTVAAEVEAADEDLAPRFSDGDVLVFVGTGNQYRDGWFCAVFTADGVVYGEVYSVRAGLRVRPANPKYAEVWIAGGKVEDILPLCTLVTTNV